MPSIDEEVWRYSRIAELDLDAYELDAYDLDSSGSAAASATGPSPAGPPAMPDAVRAALAAYADRAAAVVVSNGAVVHAEVAPRWAAAGVLAGPLASVPGAQAALGSVLEEPTDVFALMNDAFSAEPVLVQVPAGLVVDEPVVVVNQIDGGHRPGGRAAAVFPRLVVQVGQDAQVEVLDSHLGPRTGGAGLAPGTGGLSVPVVELDVARSGRLGYVNVQDLDLGTWQLSSQVSRVDTEASLVSACAGLGGDYARQRTDTRLVGRGATGTLLAVYFGEADQTLDFRTFQDHAAPDTTSNLLFKGAVGGRSRSVYTGLIRVRKNARGTNAFQTNRNVKLSDGAWAESVPNLEIENNDVRCSHASAVGPIDEDQRFYLESRGLPPDVAERLVVGGFFGEVLAQFPVPAAHAGLGTAVAEKFERRES